MDILETLVRFKDDIFQWCTNNFNQKVSNTQMINGFLLENDIVLTTDDIPGFDLLEDDIKILKEQLNGYTIKVVNDLPSIIDENTIYFIREKYIYMLCKDNIFFDVIAKIDKIITSKLMTEKIIIATDSFNASLDTADKIGTTKFSFGMINGKNNLNDTLSKEFEGLENIRIDSKANLYLIHPKVRSPKLQNKVFDLFANVRLIATSAIPKIQILYEILHNNILRNPVSRHTQPEKLFNEIYHKSNIGHPVVKVPTIYLLNESVYDALLKNSKSHCNNISCQLSLLIDEVQMPQNLPVSHKTNVFTTLLSYITSGINSRISTLQGFYTENSNKKIISNKVVSVEDVVLDKTTWQHPTLTEIEETNNNDLHIYQTYKTYKANYNNNTLIIK